MQRRRISASQERGRVTETIRMKISRDASPLQNDRRRYDNPPEVTVSYLPGDKMLGCPKGGRSTDKKETMNI
jgi:hypothetical protein